MVVPHFVMTKLVSEGKPLEPHVLNRTRVEDAEAAAVAYQAPRKVARADLLNGNAGVSRDFERVNGHPRPPDVVEELTRSRCRRAAVGSRHALLRLVALVELLQCLGHALDFLERPRRELSKVPEDDFRFGTDGRRGRTAEQ